MIRPIQDSPHLRVSIKRFAAGKVLGFVDCDPEIAGKVEQAFQKSVVIRAALDTDRFVGLLRQAGIPDAEALRLIRRVELIDEAWLQDEWPR